MCHRIPPHLDVDLHVLLELSGHLEVLAAGLAGVDLDAGQLLPMLLEVERELAVQDELIPALGADQILEERTRGRVGRDETEEKQACEGQPADHGGCRT